MNYLSEDYYKLKKRILIATGIFILIGLALFIITTPVAHASTKDELIETMQSVLEGYPVHMTDTVKNILLDNVLLKDFEITDILLTVFTSVAASLFIVFVLIEVVREAAKGEANLDFFLRLFVKIAITLLLLTNLPEIMTAIHDLFSWIIETVSDALDKFSNENAAASAQNIWELLENKFKLSGASSEDMSTMLSSALNKSSYMTIVVQLILYNVVVRLISLIIQALVYITSYSLLIELLLRRIFMPVAILNTMEGGVRSPGIRFLKKFAAMYIRILIYIAAFAFADYISATAITEVVENMVIMDMSSLTSAAFKSICVSSIFLIAASAFARKGAKLADEILGI